MSFLPKLKTGPYGPLLVCLLLILSSAGTQAQSPQKNTIIKGKVVSSKDGLPISGVTVQDNKNPNNGAVTDKDGMYQIKPSEGAKSLRFSYVGYRTVELAIQGKNAINVTLEISVASLDEVVVVGYGTQKKINQTGAVETIKFDDAVNTPVTNSAQLMYGKFSGVQLTQGSGLPGNDASSIIIKIGRAHV